MQLLRECGYECHALDFAQTGRYMTSYAEQIRRIRQYIMERIDGRPVLIGHSQGGTKAQLFMLASGGDCSVPSESRVRAVVLMASAGSSLLAGTPAALSALCASSGILRTLAAALLGACHNDLLCFLFGGGPYRHALGMYRGLFNRETTHSTLMSAQSVADHRVEATLAPAEAGGGLPIEQWADTCLIDHDPLITDLGIVPHARTPQDALDSDGCSLLHLVAERDRLVSRSVSERIGAQWRCPVVLVPKQGHQLGDAGWEQSVMEPLRSFLDQL